MDQDKSSQLSQKAIDLKNQVQVKKNKFATLAGVLFVVSTSIIVICIVFLYCIHKLSEDILIRIIEIFFVISSIELLLHFIFGDRHASIIESIIAFELYKSQETAETVLNNKSNEITEKLNESSEDILRKLEENRFANDGMNKSGIKGVKRFNTLSQFLKEAEKYCKDNSQSVDIKILVTFINELNRSYEKNDDRKVDAHFVNFKVLIKSILELHSGNSIEIILPNWHNDQICDFIKLRGKSFEHDRVNEVKYTSNNLIAIHDEIKCDRFNIKFHEQFTGFPILSYGQNWYQGNYLYSKPAEEVNYIQYSSETDVDGLGKEISLHYQHISKCSRGLDNTENIVGFRNYHPYIDQNAGAFLNSMFIHQEKESMSLRFSKGKKYCFYTHAAYKQLQRTHKNDNSNRKSHSHFLSTSIILITGDYQDNCYKAQLHVKTKGKDKDGNEVDINIEHKGIITIDKSMNIFMIFEEVNSEKKTNSYQSTTAPVLISGRLPHDRPDLLILHHSFLSHQRKSNISNIGILDLAEYDGDMSPNLSDLVLTGDSTKDQIVLFLMRKNKVSIKTPHVLTNGHDEYIYSVDQVRTFFNNRFAGIEEHLGEYILFYPKSNIPNPLSLKDYGKAELNILANGIVEFSIRSIGENNEDVSEEYYGDMNFQQTDGDNPVVSVKFVRSMKGSGHPTCYRELFLFLFWDSKSYNMDFEITRGIVLGDRDYYLGNNQKRKHERPIIESNQCVLVNKEKFQKESELNKLDILQKALIRERKLMLSGTEFDLKTDTKSRGNFVTIQYDTEFSKLDDAKKRPIPIDDSFQSSLDIHSH